MRIHEAQQGTDEWLLARSTILTASKFAEALTPAKLEASTGEKARARINLVAAARVFGLYESEFQSEDMETGSEREPEARCDYTYRTGNKVQQVGLCLTNDGLFGASPDGLIGEDGGLEIKCPKLSTQLDRLLDGTVPVKYRLQIQGALWVTGRAWWDFFSYYPGLPPLLVRVLPDDAVFAAFDEALPKFEHAVQQAVARLEALK